MYVQLKILPFGQFMYEAESGEDKINLSAYEGGTIIVFENP